MGVQSPSEGPAHLWPLPSSQALGHPSVPPKRGAGPPVHRGPGVHRGTERLSLQHRLTSPLPHLHMLAHMPSSPEALEKGLGRSWFQRRGGDRRIGIIQCPALTPPPPGKPAICRSPEVAIWRRDLCSLCARDGDQAGRQGGLAARALWVCV